MDPGAIAGIVIGCICFVALLVLAPGLYMGFIMAYANSDFITRRVEKKHKKAQKRTWRMAGGWRDGVATSRTGYW